MKNTLLLLISLFLNGNIFAQQETRLMRFPSVHGNMVVFSYAEDLYSVPKSGGVAQRLTSSAGNELFARISPDGKNIALSGQYDGNTEVYLMPVTGGTPKRLTITATLGRDDVSDRMGPNNIVMTWKDNEQIVYRSRKESFNDFKGKLYIANVNGGLSDELPLPCGGFCSFSPDGKQLAYNRIFREFRTWKYYHGGMADDIWIYDFNTKQTINITNNPAQDIEPMWTGNKIYFLSDRDRTMNLFCYDLTTKQTRKVTNYTDYDIKFASLGDKDIVWERGGYLYTMDLATETVTQVKVQINGDFPASRNELIDAGKFIEGSDISPDGKRMLYVARGDVFTVPAESGITRNLDKSSSSHERNARWSPDGKWIAYISDKSGEDEIYIRNQTGEGEPVQITKNADTYKYALEWSPDSKNILWADKKMRLQYVDINSKVVTQVDEAEVWEFGNYNWSSDSKWIVYTRPEKDRQSTVYIYNITNKTKTAVTDGWYDTGSASFSSDGKYLVMVSSRDFNPTFSSTDFQISYSDMSKIYLLPLSKDTPSPFAPKDDEVAMTKDSTAKATDEKQKTKSGKKEEPKKTETKDIKVDLDGISSRLISIPVDAANYWNIQMIGDKVYYMKSAKGKKASMYLYDVKENKEVALGEYNGFNISSNLKKILVTKDENQYITDLPSAKFEVDKAIDKSGLKVTVNHHEEWNQIFNESWRQMRDFFYAPNMQGLDWKAIHDKYAVLIPYVNHRADLSYIIGEMIGEINIGHAYVGGGDMLKGERIPLGLLGATYKKDAVTGYFQITKILKGANWSSSLRSPLTELGINVTAGNYIIAVNGMPVNNLPDINEAFINTAGKQVELTVNTKPSADGAKKIIVVPIKDESELYYYNWVQHNIDYVDSVSGGKIGYLHIPDMGVGGLNEFMKHFYPQITKKALIIDDRGNGGGFVSPLIAERLSKELVYFNMLRNAKVGHTNPDMHWGPKVCLMNEYSASDGDIFPYRFRKYQLGKLIGKRSWGGVVGIRGSLPFIDGGTLNRPEFAPYDETGWKIEGHGVDPDIVIDNDPAREYAGIDDQLNKAIEVLLDELKTQENNIPPIPPFPDKTK